MIYDQLENYGNWLKEEIQELSVRLRDAPQGCLRIVCKHGNDVYYHVLGKTMYIPKNQKDYAMRLAQSEYDKKMLLKLERQLSGVEKLLLLMQKNDLIIPYAKMNLRRKALINPVVIDDAEYVRRWKAVSYVSKEFSEEAPELYSASGIRVRSKSEVMIADVLTRFGIPFRYEFPLEMKSGVVFYPDFFCLDMKNRREIVWEHFGMMDDSDYVQGAIFKQNEYVPSGWIPGKNLIFTMETVEKPLSSKYIEKIVRGLFL